MGIALAAGALAALALPGAASAAVTCSFNSATQRVTVDLGTNGDQATIRQEALVDGGRILVHTGVAEVPCLEGGVVPADDSNTNDIIVSEPATLNTSVDINLDGGGFVNTIEPGTHPEMEIYTQFAQFGDNDTFRLYGTSGDDHWVLGSNGINFNAGLPGDTDVDIGYAGGDTTIESNQFAPGVGDDFLDGRGGGLTGAETAIALRVFGDIGEDTLLGGSAGDSLSGDDGGDTVVGRGGDDSFLSGPGDDTLDGAFESGGTPDTLNFAFSFGVTVDFSQIGIGSVDLGSDGVDTITGDFKTLAGSPGPDVLKGTSGTNITIRGQAGNDLIEGGTGDENLRGGPGSDLIRGGPGNDSLWGSETFPADPGVDTVAYDTAPAGVDVDLNTDSADGGAGSDGIAFFENVIGSSFADTISGDAAANVLTGGGGPDQVFGRAGADALMLRDGVADTGDCGSEGDTAVVDAPGVDTLIGCESVAFPFTAAVAPPPDDARACAELRAKLKKAKKRLKAAKRKDKPTKKKRKQVRKLKRQLREHGC